MNEENVSQEVKDFLSDLLAKSQVANEKTKQSANCHLLVDDLLCYVRVDDFPLLYIGTKLLPNIVNYLVNILPQFLYPYIVAYLQDLSSYREDPFTINELYNLLKDSENGNIFDSTEAED